MRNSIGSGPMSKPLLLLLFFCLSTSHGLKENNDAALLDAMSTPVLLYSGDVEEKDIADAFGFTGNSERDERVLEGDSLDVGESAIVEETVEKEDDVKKKIEKMPVEIQLAAKKKGVISAEEISKAPSLEEANAWANEVSNPNLAKKTKSVAEMAKVAKGLKKAAEKSEEN